MEGNRRFVRFVLVVAALAMALAWLGSTAPAASAAPATEGAAP